MKATLSGTIFCFLFLAINTLSAQETNETEKSNKGWKFAFESAALTGSYYSPDLSFWNKISEIRTWDTKFQAFPIYGANVEIGLRDNLRVRAEGGFASGSARQSVIPAELGGGSQSKTINMVPLSAVFLYQFLDHFILIPYLGAGAGTIFITSSYERNPQAGDPLLTKTTATDYMFYGVGGIKFPAAYHLSIGAEVRGAFGNYRELVMGTNQTYSLQHISLDGVQMLLSLNYTFGKK